MDKTHFFLTLFSLILFTAGVTLHQQKISELEKSHDKEMMQVKDNYNKKVLKEKNKSFQKGYRSYPDTVKLSTLNNSKELDKIQVDNYVFQTKDNFSNQTIGRIHLDTNTIKIKQNLTRFQAFETCQHELVHDNFPEYRHAENINKTQDLIYKLEDEFVSPTCLKVIDQLNFQN